MTVPTEEATAADGPAARHAQWIAEAEARKREMLAVRNWTPSRFHTARLDNFECRTPAHSTALKWAESFVQHATHRPDVGIMLALIGPTRAGKSHLLYAVAHALSAAGVRAYVRPWYRLADELRWGDGTNSGAWYRTQLWDAKVVLLDEVRRTSGTDLDSTELARYACHAWDDQRHVMLTTNVSPLSEILGEPAAARFTQVTLGGAR